MKRPLKHSVPLGSVPAQSAVQSGVFSVIACNGERKGVLQSFEHAGQRQNTPTAVYRRKLSSSRRSRSNDGRRCEKRSFDDVSPFLTNDTRNWDGAVATYINGKAINGKRREKNRRALRVCNRCAPRPGAPESFIMERSLADFVSLPSKLHLRFRNGTMIAV